MPIFNVTPKKEKELRERMASLGIHEKDCQEQFVRGSGAGGQKINKASICVKLHHIPTGISVRCQRERSRAINRFLARRLLCNKIEKLRKGFIADEKKRVEKIRRQKRKRSRRAKEKMLETKKKNAQKKKLRSPVKQESIDEA